MSSAYEARRHEGTKNGGGAGLHPYISRPLPGGRFDVQSGHSDTESPAHNAVEERRMMKNIRRIGLFLLLVMLVAASLPALAQSEPTPTPDPNANVVFAHPCR